MFGLRQVTGCSLSYDFADMAAPRQVQMDSIDESKVSSCWDSGALGCNLLRLYGQRVQRLQEMRLERPTAQVIVHHACCCCYDGCVPECNNIGCAAQETFLCCEADICFKTGSPCLCCGCCALRCVWPTTCCKTQLGRPLGDVSYLSVSDV